MNSRSFCVGNTEVVFQIPPKLRNKATREELDFVANFAVGAFPKEVDSISVFFRQTMRGNNTAPRIAIRDHSVDLASGTIGAVIQLSRDRRFEISFGVPKGCKKQDLVAVLMRNADGGMEVQQSDRDAGKRDDQGVTPNHSIIIEPETRPVVAPVQVPAVAIPNQEVRPVDGDDHPTVDRGRFTRLLLDPQKKKAIEDALRQHARPDGSIENGAVSAILAVHMDIKEGDLVAPAYTALVSSVHGAPLLEREITMDGVKCYWLPGRIPKSAISKNGNGGDKRDGHVVPIQHQNGQDESGRLLDDCRQGIDAFERLIAIVDHVSASSEEIRNLRTQLAQATYDRDHNLAELRKAQEEIGGLRATVEGLDKLVAGHRGHERHYREIAGELETTKAQLSALREENQKLLSKLEGLRKLLGN